MCFRLILVSLALLQPFGYSLRQHVHDEGNGTSRIVVGWDREVHRARIGIGVHHGEHGDAQLLGLCQCDVLFHDVHDEDGRWDAGQVGDRTEVLFEFRSLTADLQALTLRQGVQCAVLLHLVDLRHLTNRLANRGEVGQHAARPTLRYVRHADGCHALSNDGLGLFLGRHEKDFLSALGDLLHR